VVGDGEYELKRLVNGGAKPFTGEQTEPLTITTATQVIVCKKATMEGELIGSEKGTAGSSKEDVKLTECEVKNNGEKCEVEGGEIKGIVLENWLDKQIKKELKTNTY
jgi:hypothetical protein